MSKITAFTPKEKLVANIKAVIEERDMTSEEAARKLKLNQRQLGRLLRGHHVYETVGSLQRHLERLLRDNPQPIVIR